MVGNYAVINLNVNESNKIDIGNLGATGESGVIRIGNEGTQTATYIAGINGVTTRGSAVAVLVDGNGQLGTVSSSRRYKEDIHRMGAASDGLLVCGP